MATEVFITAEEVAKVLGVSKPYAYKLIQRLNEELKQKNCLTISGRIDRRYLAERVYGLQTDKKGSGD